MLVVLFYQAKTGSQTETLTCSSNAMLFKSPEPGLFRWAAGSPPFPSRCMTTVGNNVESATQDSTISESDEPPRIKFKRLDKTAKHIMQACIYLLAFMIRDNCSLPIVIFVNFILFTDSR